MTFTDVFFEVLFIALFILPASIYSIYSIKNPEAAFMLGRKEKLGWDYEPNEMEKDIQRIRGIVFIIAIGIIFIAKILRSCR